MSTAILLAHPELSAAQAIEVARLNRLALVHMATGNYRFESSDSQVPSPATDRGRSPRHLNPAVAGFSPEEA